MAKLERIYTVPLGEVYKAPRNKRVPKAVKMLKAFIAKHMKAEDQSVLLSENLNKYLWRNSIQKPPRKVKVRLIKEAEEVRAYLSDEKIEEKKPEAKKEEKKEEKKAEPKKEETPKEAKKEEKHEKKKPEVKAPPKKEEVKDKK